MMAARKVLGLGQRLVHMGWMELSLGQAMAVCRKS